MLPITHPLPAIVHIQAQPKQNEPGENSFVDAGIPAASRMWMGQDYVITQKILTSGKVKPPRYSDPKGAELLDRMTSLENLAFSKYKEIPLNLRYHNFLQILQATTAIETLYYAAGANYEDVPPKEESRFVAFMLYVAEVGAKLLPEQMSVIPHDDHYAENLERQKRALSGMADLFLAAEVCLSHRTHFSEEQLSHILLAMKETLPGLLSSFKSDFRAELRKELVRRRSEFKSEADIQNIESMIRTLGS
jgi:hypothetical protein